MSVSCWSGTEKVYIIPIHGDIEPGIATFVERALENAGDGTIILEIDTYGGRVDSALKIVDLLLDASNDKTIAFINKKALSAGALIALSCGRLVMKNNSTIGDCAPISFSNDKPELLGEKFQSPIRAKFRTIAKKNNYPVKLAEAMVTADMEVYKVDVNGVIKYLDKTDFEDLKNDKKNKVKLIKTLVDKGELLTMDDSEALELGFSRFSVTDIEDLLKKLEIENSEVIKINETWSESFVRLICTYSSILFLIGMAALYIELKSPGLGLPGLIGVICLSLVFFSQYIVGLASQLELLLIITGFVLICLEVFVIPGFGVAGIAGFICIIAGIVLSFQDFVIPDPKLPWQQGIFIHNSFKILATIVISFILSYYILKYLIPKISKTDRGPYLMTNLDKSFADSLETKNAELGSRGIAMTSLRPSGKMKIEDEIFDVVTEGEFIEKGSEIYIPKIKGNWIVVK